MHMLVRLILRHIMNNDFKNTGIKGAGQNVRQFRRQPARSKRIIINLIDKKNQESRKNINDQVQKILIDLRLAARQQFLKDILVLVNIGDEARKADIGIVLLVCFLLLP